MSVRFILGKSSKDNSEWILHEIQRELQQRPEGPSIFYLVPDQMTFQQEYRLLKSSELEGTIRAQVFSFSRLAWRVFQETGGGIRKYISSTGIQMLLRKITNEQKGEYKVFQKAVEKQGFMDQLEGMITELKRYCVTPELLKDQIQQMKQFQHTTPQENSLMDKLHDLSKIYEALSSELVHHYMDAEDRLQMLIDKIPSSKELEGATIYLDGFYRFTPQELQVIQVLMQKVRRVTLAVTVDPTSFRTPEELDLFYQATTTHEQVREIAEEIGIPIEEPVLVNHQTSQPYLVHLADHFDDRPAPAYIDKVPLVIGQSVNPRAEVEGVAREILSLVRQKNYRYKDVAIFIRQPEVYHDLIATVFEDYRIPVFIDVKRTMLNHPLIEVLRSLLELVEGNWKYDAMFRILKTGLIPPTNEEFPLTSEAIDELENYVLEYGIRSKSQWMNAKSWTYQRFKGFNLGAKTEEEKKMEERLQAYRMQVVEWLAPIDEQLRSGKTVQEKCESLYIWLEKINAPQTLERWRSNFDARGELEKGREQEQVWVAVIQLFDELVEMIGEEISPLSSFRTIVDAGFESLQFAHVPPSMDHVIVGSVDQSRISGMRAAFLLGVNEGLWPMKPPSDSLISENERELLKGHGMQLADSNKRQLLDDRFYIYLAFTAPSDFLWVSYTLSDEEGKTKIPSSYIKRTMDIFPKARQELLLQDAEEAQDVDPFITTKEKTLSMLTSELARSKRGYPIHEKWWRVLHWYLSQPEDQPAKVILHSLFYQNEPVSLEETTTRQLYPEVLQTSVSRLESYFSCSYKHFLQYGLGLNERPIFQLEAPDIGQLFHEALKKISEWIMKDGGDWKLVSKKDTDAYARKAVQELGPILQHQILASSNRYQYIQKKLEQVIARAAYVISQQAKASLFSPVGFEIGFGPNELLPPVDLPLPNGYKIQLRGRIDRVEKAQEDDRLFLRIIDYKSSSKGLKLSEIYHGLSLQMLTYLDVVLTHAEQWLGLKASPAGVLYFHVHNPMLSEEKELSDDQIEQEIFKKFKMQGLLLENEDVVRMMDTQLDSGSSSIIPVGLKKNGGFYQYSRTAQEENFDQLKRYIRGLMVQAGLDITNGKVELNPFQQKQKSACTFCSYRSVCQFDPTMENNEFRLLKDFKDEEVWAELKRKEEE
ncbi:helicase-exonuclease AddAB subunit AddB [Bacillaceae bacterium S4-13-56]